MAARNEAQVQPSMNLQIARAYLSASDPTLISRTWQQVMDFMEPLKQGPTRARWTSAMRGSAFDGIRGLTLMETNAEHLFATLRKGTISTNMFLRRLHNYALDMDWIPRPIIPRKQWPPVRHKERRAITREDHNKIVDREYNPEIKAYYQTLWHLGGAQTDVAQLDAKSIDWTSQTIGYSRNKTGVPVVITFGPELAAVLRSRPSTGPLFPNLARIGENHRAKMFIKRLKTVGLKGSGLSLHSYRYAWAERAKTVGMPERYAQQALGHTSKAFARAYSKNAKFSVPALETYERDFANRVVTVHFGDTSSGELKQTAN